jgi:polyphosphate glucokinase
MKKTKTSKQRKATKQKSVRTLAIDIGGTGIKAIVLDEKGQPITERGRIVTPRPATPKAVLKTIVELAKAQGAFDRVSIGFPGVIKKGVTFTAPNLHPTWRGFDLVAQVERRLGKPVRAANDADVQGFGAIQGTGVELVVTLGTGFGSALFVDGRLVPNLEIAHHPFRSKKTYEQELGEVVLKAIGKKKWNKRLEDAIQSLEALFNYDRLCIGGGNAKKVTLKLPKNVTLISNVAGLLGGIAFWQMDEASSAKKKKVRA